MGRTERVVCVPVAALLLSLLISCVGGQTGELASPTRDAESQPDASNDRGGDENPIVYGDSGKPDAAADSGGTGNQFLELKSTLPSELVPEVSEADLAEFVQGNSEFALDMYRELVAQSSDQNLLFAPYSISALLAMTYAGAAGDTRRQMAEALHFTLPEAKLHAAFNKVDLLLRLHAQTIVPRESQWVGLNLLNSIWTRKDGSFADSYLDLLATNYGAGLYQVDFARDPARSREIINRWVAGQTANQVEELLPGSGIDAATRMVLADAAYFNAAWLYTFDPKDTVDGEFHALSGRTVPAQMMNQISVYGVFFGEGYEAVELLFGGEQFSMIILAPDAGDFAAFEAKLSVPAVQEALTGLLGKDSPLPGPRNLKLSMPKWKSSTQSVSLKDSLSKMGVTDAFSSSEADFSRMDGKPGISIHDGYHQAFFEVDESGTEAATGVVVDLFGSPGLLSSFSLDRPFIFLIRDIETNVILFLGRVVDPGLGS
jgi:serpin B